MSYRRSLFLFAVIALFSVGQEYTSAFACSGASATERSSQQRVEDGERAGGERVVLGERPSLYQPPPEDQHPYVPLPEKRYIPLAGDSTGPVIILPGGNGPQRD
ncbi:hypothetical protein PsAD2_03391 [Pseudovibrio axinellae]|uniref:Uncharacterized protein n=1 Tax=Pseudovibrio axinellae TaxID=989403 RepID=A0A165WPV0_9HYPH|nr:hypothetical protein [Pseudovibrio axinellae]KZL16774.1 hypothetical protein PsAD2_03391 [Pseudovibrio axinellae]SEQ75170.1 hypothetical protein SAMN05421798_104119 [Pseudovibrio axinellae]